MRERDEPRCHGIRASVQKCSLRGRTFDKDGVARWGGIGLAGGMKTHRIPSLALWGAVLLLVSGCIAPKAFIDLKYRDAAVSDLRPRDPLVSIVLETEFQLNGKPRSGQAKLVRAAVVKALDASRVLAATPANPVTTGGPGRLRVVVNDIADLGDAAGKGFVTGLTFGASGSEVVDAYEMTASLELPGRSPAERRYQHAIHTVIGSHAAPANMEPLPLSQAFDRVVQDMIFNFIRDLQKDGVL